MKYLVVAFLCMVDSITVCSDMKDHMLPLELSNTQRDPFSWSGTKEQKPTKEIAQEEPMMPVQVELPVKTIEKPTWHVYGAATTKRDAFALLRNGTHQRLVQKGADLGDGWKVLEVTTHKIMCVHETGEQWIVGV